MGQEILIADDKPHIAVSQAHLRKREDHEVCQALLPRRREAPPSHLAPPRGAGTGDARPSRTLSTRDTAGKARSMPVGATGTTAG